MKELIQKLHSEGLLNTEIALIINKSPDTVAYYLKKFNLINNRNENSIRNKDLILKLLKKGITAYNISKQTNCSTSVISRIAKENNIITQTKEEYIEKIKKVKNNPFENLNDSNVNYWLGFLSADGSVYEDRIRLGLQEQDLTHIVKFKDFINSDLRIIKTIKDNTYIGYNVAFRNKEVVDFLINMGITSNKSLTLEMNLNITKDFIRGVVDGDGYIRKKGYEVSIATGSEIFAEQLKKSFVNLFNITPKIYKNSKNHKNTIYNVTILGKEKVKFVLKELYTNADTYLERKYQNAVLIGNN